MLTMRSHRLSILPPELGLAHFPQTHTLQTETVLGLAMVLQSRSTVAIRPRRIPSRATFLGLLDGHLAFARRLLQRKLQLAPLVASHILLIHQLLLGCMGAPFLMIKTISLANLIPTRLLQFLLPHMAFHPAIEVRIYREWKT